MGEFRNAMIDSGMMPLGFEVKELFEEADEDGSQVDSPSAGPWCIPVRSIGLPLDGVCLH